MRTPARGRRTALGGVIAVLTLALCACGITIPTDPRGTSARIAESGELHAGASPAAPAVAVDGERVSGPLAELVETFAERHGAEVEWTVGSEEQLVEGLEDGSLDLVIGGMTDRTPWIDRASATRGYTAIPGTDGRTTVVLLPLGENALQAELERFLDAEVGR
ncbi:hypothetical protein [Agromyces sp. LHK192]|uniref:transporter substrate-binding domain-containing protein n=1 Tax=Agromyces sp. LHK192 TaxID=2498704 RepID=UPI001F0BFB53|nr:hypothetical protein [Agromyces sp. LHK192]